MILAFVWVPSFIWSVDLSEFVFTIQSFQHYLSVFLRWTPINYVTELLPGLFEVWFWSSDSVSFVKPNQKRLLELTVVKLATLISIAFWKQMPWKLIDLGCLYASNRFLYKNSTLFVPMVNIRTLRVHKNWVNQPTPAKRLLYSSFFHYRGNRKVRK